MPSAGAGEISVTWGVCPETLLPGGLVWVRQVRGSMQAAGAELWVPAPVPAACCWRGPKVYILPKMESDMVCTSHLLASFNLDQPVIRRPLILQWVSGQKIYAGIQGDLRLWVPVKWVSVCSHWWALRWTCGTVEDLGEVYRALDAGSDIGRSENPRCAGIQGDSQTCVSLWSSGIWSMVRMCFHSWTSVSTRERRKAT